MGPGHSAPHAASVEGEEGLSRSGVNTTYSSGRGMAAPGRGKTTQQLGSVLLHTLTLLCATCSLSVNSTEIFRVVFLFNFPPN